MAKWNGTVMEQAKQDFAGAKPVIDFQLCRWKRIEESLLQKLMDFSREVVSENAASHAMNQFWGEEGMLSTEFDDEASFARFFDWFVFDYRRSNRSRRIIERFNDTQLHILTEDERVLLSDWLSARMGFYEVTSVKPGMEVVLTDVFTGNSIRVPEKSVSQTLHKYDLIFTRPLKVFGIHSFSVAGLVIPRSWKQYIESAVRYELARFRRWYPEAGYDELFRNRAYRFNRLLIKILLERGRPSIRTTSGEEFIMSRAWYEVIDPEGVIDTLSKLPDLKLERHERDQDGNPVSATWAWFYPLSNGDLPYVGSLILGEIRLQKGYLSLQCLSRERLENGKRLLGESIADMVRHRLDDYAAPPLYGLIKQTPVDIEKTARSLSPEVEEAMGRFLASYYRRWMDEPVESLGGRSPRNACENDEGRRQVIELLKLIENMEDKKRRAGEPFIEVNSIRRELGLPEEE